MQKEEFKALLFSATESSKSFALNYINNNLPPDNVYDVHLSLSHDDPTLTQFGLYPGDKGVVIEKTNDYDVVQMLLRKGKVPVWINILVSAIRIDKTVSKLFCAGRYSDDMKEMYYHESGLGPFGVKSPSLPVDFKEGSKFILQESQTKF